MLTKFNEKNMHTLQGNESEKASRMKGRVGYGVIEVKMVIKLFASDLIIRFRMS